MDRQTVHLWKVHRDELNVAVHDVRDEGHVTGQPDLPFRKLFPLANIATGLKKPFGNVGAMGEDMGRRLRFVDLAGMHHLMDGLTFKVSRCADVLDGALVELDKQTGVPRKIFEWNQRGSNLLNPPSFHLDGRLIVTIEQSCSPAKGKFLMSKVLVKKGERETAPVVHFEMRSPTLDIPMRVEVPLRALVKGGKKLKGTHAVYLHALLFADNAAPITDSRLVALL